MPGNESTSTTTIPAAPVIAPAENQQQHFLLHRIGGPAALEAAVEILYEKLLNDDNLARFFEGVDMGKLKLHQRKFLTIALTEIPKEINVSDLMKEKHKRFFAMGLNETHFDRVAAHLGDTLRELQVKEGFVEEIISVIAPLRIVFETGKKEHLLDKIGGSVALEAAVDIFYEKIVADPYLSRFFDGINLNKLKEHQRGFLTIAFTEIPEGVDMSHIIATKHASLFQDGLNETHFDKVAGHLMETLDDLQVRKDYIDEVIAIIAPLRAVFEEGARAAR
jgi:hemoglobin